MGMKEKEKNKMNKTELARKIATEKEITIKAATEAIETVVNTIADTLVDGEEIKIAGFGTFSVVERAAREGRNPATGETIQIEASKSPKFKASKTLKDAVKNA